VPWLRERWITAILLKLTPSSRPWPDVATLSPPVAVPLPSVHGGVPSRVPSNLSHFAFIVNMHHNHEVFSLCSSQPLRDAITLGCYSYCSDCRFLCDNNNHSLMGSMHATRTSRLARMRRRRREREWLGRDGRDADPLLCFCRRPLGCGSTCSRCSASPFASQSFWAPTG
jgi:hypothetical protein